METQKYTTKQIIDGGLEIVKILLDFCSKTGDINSYSKSNLKDMDEEQSIHQQQQQALAKLSEISTSMSTDAETMISSSKATTGNLDNTVSQFNEFSAKVLTVAKEGETLSKRFTELNEKIKEITNMVDSIQEISARTNLLSFNASIEAAHAGEAGKGFRIIANEVKKLSESTDNTSKQISDKIKLLNDKLNELILSNAENTKKLMELETATKQSVQMVMDFRTANDKNTAATMGMIEHLRQSQQSIEETVETVKKVENLNRQKLKNIEDSGKKAVIQVNDRISFIVELEQIFKYLKEQLQ